MVRRELKVSNVVIWKYTANNMGVSFTTNDPLAFHDWASDTLNGFEIENFDVHLVKMGKFNRLLSEKPDAIPFKLRVRFAEEIDAAIFKMRWCG